MEEMPRPRLVRHSPAVASGGRPPETRPPETMAASAHETRHWSVGAVLFLFCLILLPAQALSRTDDRLAPADRVEVRISGWSALRGGFAGAVMLNNAYTISKAGTVELPFIGRVQAAGLRAHELAKLIADRLQTRSGFHIVQ